MTIVEWKPAVVKKMALDQLEANAELVGVFVETEARQRLDAITDPDTARDKNYRHYLSKYLLTHVVEKSEKEIVISVGMRVGPRGSGAGHHGFFIETGSESAPAHPYLRPAVFGNAREIVNLLTGK